MRLISYKKIFSHLHELSKDCYNYQVMKILYAEDEEMLRELLVFTLDAEFDCEVLEASSGNQAIALLKENPDIKIVLSDYTMPDGTGGDLYNYIKDNCPEIPFVLISGNSPDTLGEFDNFKDVNPNNAYFSKPFDENTLLQTLKEIINGTDEAIADAPPPAYCKVNIRSFYRFNQVSSNIYLRLSEEKYIKVINPQELYDVSQMEKYEHRGCKYLYVESKDYPEFSEFFVKSTIARFELGKALSDGERVSLEVDSLKAVTETIHNLGISESVIELTNNISSSVIENFDKESQLAKLLKSMMENKEFRYQHALLISYIGCAILKKMKLQTESTLQKFTIASLLHDIDFEDEELARVHDILGTEHEGIEYNTIERIKAHPQLAAELVKEMKNLPPDVDTIILSHHELPDGSGYPRGMGALKLSPLSCIFIVTERIVEHIWDSNFDVSGLPGHLESLKESYMKGNFKKPFQAAQELFGE